MAKITYLDKVALNENTDIPDINKVKANDMNEIKNVVNDNYDDVGDIANLNTEDISNVVNAINEVNNKFNYSAEEKIIGTWFGKKLYRKTFYRSPLINGTQETVAHGIQNVDKIWADVSKSFAIWPAGFTGKVPYLNSNFANSIFLTDIGATTFKLTSGLDRSNLSGYITLLYTKTTD